MAEISRRNFLTGSALAALGGGLALAGCSPAGSKGSSAAGDGAYVGSAMGKHGNFDIEVVMKGGAIERINVLESNETLGLGDVAMDTMSKLIVDKQTLNVDTVSGATLTSMAFLSAVGDAVDASGAKASEWKKRDHAAVAVDEKMPTEADLIVVGSGGAGFTAAITAARLGKKVLFLEKLGVRGGSTALSGGEMAAPNCWIQNNLGLQDSPEQLAADMLKGGDNKGDPDLVNVIANGVLDATQWLTYEGGVSWENNLLFFGGHSVRRSMIPTGHIGNAMTTALTARCKKIDNITLIDYMKATELVKDASGAVTGVKAESTITGDPYTFKAKAVVLTTGGFGSNVEMRTKNNPEMGKSIGSTDCVGAMGEGLDMASAIGAELIDMQYIQTYPICDTETGALIYIDDMRLEGRTLMINKEGKRFVEELDRRDVLSKAITSQTGGVAYEIFNQAAEDETSVVQTHIHEFENLTSRKLMIKADTLEDACALFEIDAAELKKTIEHWNEMCKTKKDVDYNFRADMVPIEEGPYYLLVYKPAVHYTMGGLHINVNAEVLDTAGKTIPGLFAAGEVAGHKMGTNRLGSTSMADIYTFGRVAGKSAAAYIG
ncbi:MAG: flavocytochrome c [Raoultibacter sp.]